MAQITRLSAGALRLRLRWMSGTLLKNVLRLAAGVARRQRVVFARRSTAAGGILKRGSVATRLPGSSARVGLTCAFRIWGSASAGRLCRATEPARRSARGRAARAPHAGARLGGLAAVGVDRRPRPILPIAIRSRGGESEFRPLAPELHVPPWRPRVPRVAHRDLGSPLPPLRDNARRAAELPTELPGAGPSRRPIGKRSARRSGPL